MSECTTQILLSRLTSEFDRVLMDYPDANEAGEYLIKAINSILDGTIEDLEDEDEDDETILYGDMDQFIDEEY